MCGVGLLLPSLSTPLSFPLLLTRKGAQGKAAALGLPPGLLGHPRGCLLPSHLYIHEKKRTFGSECVGCIARAIPYIVVSCV